MAVLTVDGTEISLGRTQCLRQRDPYPGGHRYRLVVEETQATKKLFTGVIPGTTPSDQDEWAILRDINRLVRIEKIEELPADFLLNSVDSFLRDGGRICIEGVCSEVVRP